MWPVLDETQLGQARPWLGVQWHDSTVRRPINDMPFAACTAGLHSAVPRLFVSLSRRPVQPSDPTLLYWVSPAVRPCRRRHTCGDAVNPGVWPWSRKVVDGFISVSLTQRVHRQTTNSNTTAQRIYICVGYNSFFDLDNNMWICVIHPRQYYISTLAETKRVVRSSLALHVYGSTEDADTWILVNCSLMYSIWCRIK